MNKLRKFLVVGVMVLTAIMTAGITAPTAKASASAGDLIKMAGLSSVYYLGSDGKRYVFPNEATYMSWYSDFSGVVTIPATELQSYPLGGNVVMRAGTKLVKITTDPSVYAVLPNGVLSKIQSEAQAAALYGTNWNKRVVDVSDAFFTNYTIGAALANGAVPTGSLVKNADNAAIYYFDGTNYRSIASESAFNANKFAWGDVITISNTITAGGNAITSGELHNVAQNGGTGIVVTGSGLMVSLSSNTATSNSVISGQALADLASFNFTAANDGQVIVKGLKLKRIGISGDDSLLNVYLFDGVTRLTDGATFSNGMVSFSSGTGLLTVPAGQTKTLTVKADVSGTTGNVGVSINAASDITSTGAATTGGFPLVGNLMSMTSASGIASTTLTSTIAKTGNTAKAGNMNTIVWSETAVVSNKAVDFKYIAFKQIGSMNVDDLANLSLYVDGTKVGTSALSSNNDLAFNLATPVRLNTGNHTIELKADIIKGSSRTFSFALQTAANAVFTDTNYNVNIAAVASTDVTNGNAITIAPAFTISQGTLSVSADTTFSDTQVVKTANNVTLSRFKVKAFGEDVKVNTLSVAMVTSGSLGAATTTEKINDLAVVVNGNQVGSSKSLTLVGGANATYTALDFGTSNLFVIPAGTEVVVEIKGSLALDSNTLMTNVKANISSISGQGVTSYLPVTSAATPANNSLSIVSGSMTVAQNTNVQGQYVSKNTQKVKIGSYIVSAGPAEGVNISNIRVNMLASSTSADLNNISNLYISENTSPVNPQANNDFNTNLTVDKSQSKTIDVYADLGDIANASTTQTALVVTYKTTVTQSFGTTNAVNGQMMTLASASLATPTNVSDTPVSGFVLGGTTSTAGNFKFVATNGAATINELYFDVVSSVSAISQITVDGVTAPVVSGKVTMTGLNTAIAAGLQGTQVEVKAAYNNVSSTGQGGVATGNTVHISLTGMKYTVNGTQMTDAAGSYTVATNDMTLVASYPTVVDASNYASKLLVPSGKSEVMRFTVAATGPNPVNIDAVSFKPFFDYTISGGKGIVIEDAANLGTDLASTTAPAVFTTSGALATANLKSTITINSGSTKTFVVFVDNTGTVATGNYFRMDLKNDGWKWNDGTISTFLGGTYIKDFVGTTFQK
ncbi:MAG: hypothetical protein WC467_02085 [Patescibacteria group bacterium]